MRQSTQTLRQLATLYGVQTSYINALEQRCQAPSESLLAVLGMLGAPVASLADVPAAFRARRQALWQRGVEPVVVIGSSHAEALDLCLPVQQTTGRLTCHLTYESGETRRWTARLGRMVVQRTEDVEGVSYRAMRLALPHALPPGYHRLRLETSAQVLETLVMAAPRRTYVPPGATDTKVWGAFLPLYALHTERSWGCGDFSDLEALALWLAAHGAGVVATLPLLAAFLDEPYEPSPYVPASRLFWNDLYIDVTRAAAKSAGAVAERPADLVPRDVLTACDASDHVDYRQVMRLKRPVLAAQAQAFFERSADHHAGFQAYVQAHPAVAHYAQFRAVGERFQAAWPLWPDTLRQGQITSGDYDARAWRYHMYAQWIAHEQLTHLVRTSRDAGVRLYLDLPLGVHPHSYDVWSERDAFVLEAAGGAPPDAYFTKGQNWGFPPLHPERIRQQGYRYVLAYLRHQLQQTGLLRIDHVMGLHRLFWVPQGAEASQGVYVRYAAKELYAMLKIESHRHQVMLVGENLGTVPQYINAAMAQHRLYRMYVVQYALTPESDPALPVVCSDTVASLNTHDMPPFAAYCQGLDIDDRLQQGLLDPRAAGREHRQRLAMLKALQQFLAQHGYIVPSTADIRALLEGCLAYLSASAAEVVLMNLEDLWLETRPQNFPGTRDERLNWQAKARYPLEQMTQMPEVLTALNQVHQYRLQRRAES